MTKAASPSKMVYLDSLDLKILNELWNMKKGSPVTTSKMAKAMFKISNKRELINKDSMLRFRLKRLTEMGLLNATKIDGNKPITRYGINEGKVLIDSAKIITKNEKYIFKIPILPLVKDRDVEIRIKLFKNGF